MNKTIQYYIPNPNIISQMDDTLVLNVFNKTHTYINCKDIKVENRLLSFKGLYKPKYHELIYGMKCWGNERHDYIIRVENDKDINELKVETTVYLNLSTEELVFTNNQIIELDYYRPVTFKEKNKFQECLIKDNCWYYADNGDILLNKPYPKYNTKYFFISATGFVDETTWLDTSADKFRYYFGNIFQTEDAAAKAAITVRSILRDF